MESVPRAPVPHDGDGLDPPRPERGWPDDDVGLTQIAILNAWEEINCADFDPLPFLAEPFQGDLAMLEEGGPWS